MNLKQIKARYARMDDARLEQIARFEVEALRPEVRSIVAAEIRKRGLDESLLIGTEVQEEGIPATELNELTGKIKGLECPSCGASDEALVGGYVRKVRSYLVTTYHEKKPMIACPSCLEAERKKQLINTSLFGWWGFPMGLLFYTPDAIIGHFRDYRRRAQISEKVLSEFAVQNIGALRTNWDRENALVELLWFKNDIGITLKPPILIEDIHWVERHLEWIQDNVLDLASQPVILPTDDAFNWKFSGQEKDAYTVFRKVSEILKIDTRKIRLAFFDEDSPHLDSWIAEYLSTGRRAAGFYLQNEEGYYILIEAKQLSDPAALIGTMVHELCHYVLMGEKDVYLEGEENEWLTDLLAIAYGFGVFIGNLKFTYNSWLSASEGGSYWKVSSQGYLPQQVTAYAMAAIESGRSEGLPDWVGFLRGDFRHDFEESMAYLWAVRASG